MAKYNSSYLVCHEHVDEVKKFLSKFFKESKGRYNHKNWITFKLPKTDFTINLMKGCDQPLTQHMVFEILCNSMEELKTFAKKNNCKIDSFTATETGKPYRYHYIQIPGPKNICKIEINFTEELTNK